METAEKTTEKKTGKRNTVRKLLTALLVLVIVYCCVYSLIMRAAKNESIPMPLGFGMGVVLTGSMEPTLSANDVIIVTKAKTYEIGDIVVYQTGGTPVTHRLIEIDTEHGTALTQGDANNAADEPITVSRIKGRVAFSIPKIGAALRFVKTVPGTVMILVVIFMLLFLTVRSKDEEEKKTEEKNDLQEQIEELKAMLNANNAAAKEEKPNE